MLKVLLTLLKWSHNQGQRHWKASANKPIVSNFSYAFELGWIFHQTIARGWLNFAKTVVLNCKDSKIQTSTRSIIWATQVSKTLSKKLILCQGSTNKLLSYSEKRIASVYSSGIVLIKRKCRGINFKVK